MSFLYRIPSISDALPVTLRSAVVVRQPPDRYMPRQTGLLEDVAVGVRCSDRLGERPTFILDSAYENPLHSDGSMANSLVGIGSLLIRYPSSLSPR